MESREERDACGRCGGPVGEDDVVVRNQGADPLQVSECAACGAIVDVGGHRW